MLNSIGSIIALQGIYIGLDKSCDAKLVIYRIINFLNEKEVTLRLKITTRQTRFAPMFFLEIFSFLHKKLFNFSNKIHSLLLSLGTLWQIWEAHCGWGVSHSL